MPTPRQRKLRLTIAALSWLGGLGLLLVTAVYYGRRPNQYDPEEADQAITSSLKLKLPAGAPEPRFTDVTAASGLSGFQTFRGERTSQLPEDMGGGAAFGDFDNDGDDDLFLVAAGGSLDLPDQELAPSQLYRNRGNGTFELVQDFPEVRLRGMGAAWGDFDGDGFIDLALSGYQVLRLFHNEAGTGRFSAVELTRAQAGFWTGVSWGDFDHDRDLDLYVCGYVDYQVNAADRQKTSDQLDTTVPFTLNPASFPPAKNRLYRNDGGRFTDIAEQLGVTNPTGRSLGAVWHDFDEDGWLEIYVANDVSDNAYFHNDGGTFRDIAHAAWVADYRSAMGLAVGDWNNDGDDDLYVTHWVAQENALYDNTYADFFKNPKAPRQGDIPVAQSVLAVTGPSGEKPKARFVDVADQRGLGQMSLPFVGWGTEFVDLDQDGWLDLLAANGSTLEEPGPAPKRLRPQELFLLWNDAGQLFHNLAPGSPTLQSRHVSRGLAVADIDGDGDQDFVIVDLDGGARLMRTDMARGNWLQVRLHSRAIDRAHHGRGEGSVVTAIAGGRQFRRAVTSAAYLSQSTATLHFGLGDLTTIERLEVRWHGGEVATYSNLTAQAVWELRERDPVPRRVGKVAAAVSPGDDRVRVLAFWQHQRAGMALFKAGRDYPAAVREFEQALALDPVHEDSLFYLANSLIELGQPAAAIVSLRRLTELNSQSLRGFQQWGTLRALTARTRADLVAAEELLLKARAINPEETGVLQVLGEVALLRGEPALADERLAQVIASNQRAARAIYLRAYLASKSGRHDASRELLKQTRAALGPEWKPQGTTHEGDVKNRMHVHTTPLSEAFARWDGNEDPARAFAPVTNAVAALTPP